MKTADVYDVPELASLKRKAIIDSILRVASYAAATTAVIVAPNIVQALDKPLAVLDKTMDERSRKRHIMQTIYYMKSRGYLAGDYEHGLRVTAKAKRRLRSLNIQSLKVVPVDQWDGIWRIVIYDIPEMYRTARIGFGSALRQAGCFQLQKSTWIIPFDCRDVVAGHASYYDIAQFVTHFEAHYLDNQQPLIRRFAKKYPMTNFDSGSH